MTEPPPMKDDAIQKARTCAAKAEKAALLLNVNEAALWTNLGIIWGQVALAEELRAKNEHGLVESKR